MSTATLAAVAFIAIKLRARLQHLDRQFESISAQVRRELETWTSTKLEEKVREVQHAFAIGQMGFRMPLFLGGWSIDAFLGRQLIQHLIDERPACVVELGSGSSTLLIARCLELLESDGHEHIAIDHEARYLDSTRRNLEINGLAQKVDLWLCPLKKFPKVDKLWYGTLLERLEGKRIDLLLIDGPPEDLQEKSRLPALPLLMPYLSERCTVMLDDAARPDEKAIAEQWRSTFPDFSLEFLSEGHGTAILRRR